MPEGPRHNSLSLSSFFDNADRHLWLTPEGLRHNSLYFDFIFLILCCLGVFLFGLGKRDTRVMYFFFIMLDFTSGSVMVSRFDIIVAHIITTGFEVCKEVLVALDEL